MGLRIEKILYIRILNWMVNSDRFQIWHQKIIDTHTHIYKQTTARRHSLNLMRMTFSF